MADQRAAGVVKQIIIILLLLPVLVELSIFHPLLGFALVRFHQILHLLNIDAVTLEDVVQGFYQLVQTLWLRHLGLLHLFFCFFFYPCARNLLLFPDTDAFNWDKTISPAQLCAVVYFL